MYYKLFLGLSYNTAIYKFLNSLRKSDVEAQVEPGSRFVDVSVKKDSLVVFVLIFRNFGGVVLRERD